MEIQTYRDVVMSKSFVEAEDIETIKQVIAESLEYASYQDSVYVMSPSELKEIFESFATRLSQVVASSNTRSEP
jgi:hypothetical protein